MSRETHHPSPEELANAAEMMTEEQRKLSEAREEGYRIVEGSPEKKSATDPAAPTIIEHGKTAQGRFYEVKSPEKPFYEKTTVNGTEFSVGWDEGYKDYTIYFPNLELGDEARERGVHDQVIRLSRKPEIAKKVFEYASQIAQIETDPFAIYKKVSDFSRDLPYGDEE